MMNVYIAYWVHVRIIDAAGVRIAEYAFADIDRAARHARFAVRAGKTVETFIGDIYIAS